MEFTVVAVCVAVIVGVAAMLIWPSRDADWRVSVDFTEYIETLDNSPNLPWVTALVSYEEFLFRAEGRTEVLVLVLMSCPSGPLQIEAIVPTRVGPPSVDDALEVASAGPAGDEDCGDLDLKVDRDGQLVAWSR